MSDNGLEIVKWPKPWTWTNAEPKWLKKALKAIPNGDMNDFYSYIKASGDSLHKGAPYAFFLKHQKKYLEAVQDKKQEKRRSDPQIAHDNSWEFPIHEINAAGTCPEDMDGLEPWDYGSGENLDVVIENRKILLTKDVTVGHLGNSIMTASYRY